MSAQCTSDSVARLSRLRAAESAAFAPRRQGFNTPIWHDAIVDGTIAATRGGRFASTGKSLPRRLACAITPVDADRLGRCAASNIESSPPVGLERPLRPDASPALCCTVH